MSQTAGALNGLLQWAATHNSILHPNIKIYEDPITALSFRASNDIPPTTIVSCPYNLTLSYLNAIEAAPCFSRYGSHAFPAHFFAQLQVQPHIIGYFFLMQQYLLREQSIWWPYIRLLPQPNEPQRLGIPIWWPKEDQIFLAGTNAGPPIETRKHLWTGEYRKGIEALEHGQEMFPEMEGLTYNLYQWAATIYGTRSFRASLSIPSALIDNETVWSHASNDRFSILIPVVDIGNHNGINNMDWRQNSCAFTLANRSTITQGSQIYNFYGDKSNSELLVGYGFMLPDVSKDTVNLKLKPSHEALALRRSQACYGPGSKDRDQNGEDFMFYVQHVAETDTNNQSGRSKPLEFRVFSEGLVDTIACMLANERERNFISQHPEYSLEKDNGVFNGGPMSRLVLHVLCILKDKLEHEEKRIVDSGVELGTPQNSNQRLAVSYRTRQLSVLEHTLSIIQSRLDAVVIRNSNTPSSYFPHLWTLPKAYCLLADFYPSILVQIEAVISQDQDEPLPLNWSTLISEGWDFTYWTVWFYVISLLFNRDDQAFVERHKALGLAGWVREMDMESTFDRSSSSHPSSFPQRRDISSYAEELEEVQTIKFMIDEINKMPEFDTTEMRDISKDEEKMRRIRATAARVGKEETVILPGAALGSMLWFWEPGGT